MDNVPYREVFLLNHSLSQTYSLTRSFYGLQS